VNRRKKTAVAAFFLPRYSPPREGESRHGSAACRLSTIANIVDRVRELQVRASMRAEISIATVTQDLQRLAEKAEALGGASGLSMARAALVDAAKLNGCEAGRSCRPSVKRLPEQSGCSRALARPDIIMFGTAHKIIVGLATFALPAAVSQSTPKPSLVVSPSSIASSGPQGGPFSPDSFQIRINASTGTVQFSVKTPSWLSVEPATGTVDVSGATIRFALTPAALHLRPGTYGPAVAFTNVTNGQGTTTRPARLAITPASGALSSPRPVPLQSSAPPGNRGYLLDNKGGRLLDDRGEPLSAR
jgi:hypothetical protein